MGSKIPCPRLEFNWVKTGDSWNQCKCVYSLVLPLREHDIRRENRYGKKIRNEIKIKIGTTTVRGSTRAPIFDTGKVDTPFRDGSHAKWDNEAIGGHLPIVAVCGDKFSICDDTDE